MSQVATVREIIDLWPTRATLAAEISCEVERVTADRVHKWAESSSIPARYWQRLIEAASRRNFTLTANDLALLHDGRGKAA